MEKDIEQYKDFVAMDALGFYNQKSYLKEKYDTKLLIKERFREDEGDVSPFDVLKKK